MSTQRLASEPLAKLLTEYLSYDASKLSSGITVENGTRWHAMKIPGQWALRRELDEQAAYPADILRLLQVDPQPSCPAAAMNVNWLQIHQLKVHNILRRDPTLQEEADIEFQDQTGTPQFRFHARPNGTPNIREILESIGWKGLGHLLPLDPQAQRHNILSPTQHDVLGKLFAQHVAVSFQPVYPLPVMSVVTHFTPVEIKRYSGPDILSDTIQPRDPEALVARGPTPHYYSKDIPGTHVRVDWSQLHKAELTASADRPAALTFFNQQKQPVLRLDGKCGMADLLQLEVLAFNGQTR